MTSSTTRKARLVATWILRVVIGLAFLGIGIEKLTGTTARGNVGLAGLETESRLRYSSHQPLRSRLSFVHGESLL
jgi:uncharacterized membrane protein YphA (DoxX/SURF4 family)